MLSFQATVCDESVLTHDELLTHAGLYARLWTLQQQTSGWRISS